MIDGCLVYVFFQDFMVFGGFLLEIYVEKICKIMDMAMKNGVFVIGLNDFGGVCIQEGVCLLGGYVDIFYCNVMVFGVVFQIFVIMGLCVGGVVYFLAMIDFMIMVENIFYMFVIGLNVVKIVINEEVMVEELGGVFVYFIKFGVIYLIVVNDIDCIVKIKWLLSYMF